MSSIRDDSKVPVQPPHSMREGKITRGFPLDENSMDSSGDEHFIVELSDDDDFFLDTSGDDSEGDFPGAAMCDDVTLQLVSAGPVGVAAAAAIVSARNRKSRHSFITDPTVRRRMSTRLLTKLRRTVEEFSVRVGQQVVVIVATPGKTTNQFKCFGAKPLEDVVKALRPVIMDGLEATLAEQTPLPNKKDPSLHELPPLVIDGMPTPVEKMTQAQLRAFIPQMLKSSTGRGKPGWGREGTRPPWWPSELPWANVRMDARSPQEKRKKSWTQGLREIVFSCYKFHGREDLLTAFSEPRTAVEAVGETSLNSQPVGNAPYHYQTIMNADGSVSIILNPNIPIATLPQGIAVHIQSVPTIHTVQAVIKSLPIVETQIGASYQPIIVAEVGHHKSHDGSVA